MSDPVTPSRIVERVLASRVAARFEIRQAASEAVSSMPRTASDRESLRGSLIALAEGALIPETGMPKSAGLGSILRKFKQIVRSVEKAPGLWSKIREFLGVENLSELPGRLKELAREGGKYLQKILGKAFSTWPLKLYTLPEAKLFSLNALLEKVMKLSPKFEAFLRREVKPRIDSFDAWLKENLPFVSKVAMVAIYVWIWFNVVEFEWDLKALLAAATGALSLSDLLSSLPASILGFLMNSLGFGTFTLFPAALVARLLVLMAFRYLSWEGGSLQLNRAKLSEDFGLSETALA